jgi:hypothetical protein
MFKYNVINIILNLISLIYCVIELHTHRLFYESIRAAVNFVLRLFYENIIRTAVNYVLELSHSVIVGYVADVSEAKSDSVFRVEV